MDAAEHQHFARLARSFGWTGYLPLTPSDLEALSGAGEYVERYPGTRAAEGRVCDGWEQELGPGG